MYSAAVDRIAKAHCRERCPSIGRAEGPTVLKLPVALAFSTVMAMSIATAPNAVHAADGLFGTKEERSSKLESFYKWNDVLRRFYRERRHTWNVPSIRRWYDFIEKTRDLPRDAQIRAVNRYANQFAYRVDSRNYGQRDYWATPREFFAKGGDGEEYAIVKYLTFKALGWRQRNLRLVVVIDQRKQMAHAILVVHHNGRRYVLDNRLADVLRDTQFKHYRPVYSINERHWWFHSGLPKRNAQGQ